MGGQYRMYLKEISMNRRNWVDSAQGRDYWRTLLNAGLNLRVSYYSRVCYLLKARYVIIA